MGCRAAGLCLQGNHACQAGAEMPKCSTTCNSSPNQSPEALTQSPGISGILNCNIGVHENTDPRYRCMITGLHFTSCPATCIACQQRRIACQASFMDAHSRQQADLQADKEPTSRLNDGERATLTVLPLRHNKVALYSGLSGGTWWT